MKYIFFILLLFYCVSSRAQTFFGVASTPTDGAAATNVTDPTVITEPASMTTGDLCVIYATKRIASGAIAISATGGQTWTQLGSTAASSAGVLSGAIFYCTFNGTWSAHPSVSFSSTTNNIVVMLVFRPSSSTSTWGAEGQPSFSPIGNTNAAGSTAFSSYTPTNGKNVCIGFMATDDDNTWTFTGTGWIQTGLSAQYRNTSGSDASQVLVYKIQTGSPVVTNSLTVTEATLGNDGGLLAGYNFYEIAAAAPLPRRITIISQNNNKKQTHETNNPSYGDNVRPCLVQQ